MRVHVTNSPLAIMGGSLRAPFMLKLWGCSRLSPPAWLGLLLLFFFFCCLLSFFFFFFFFFWWPLGLVAGLFGTSSVHHSAANLRPYLDTNAELARTLGLSLAPAFTTSGHRGTGAAESVRLRDEVMAAACPSSPTQSQLPLYRKLERKVAIDSAHAIRTPNF